MTKQELMNLLRGLAFRAESEVDNDMDPYRRGLLHGTADAYNLAVGWVNELEVPS